MTFDFDDRYHDDRVMLSVTGEYQGYNLDAYCSPDAVGDTFIDGGETKINDSPDDEHHDAPFATDIVIADNVHPQEGEVQSIRDELGTEFQAQFDSKVDNVFEKISGDGEPLDTILEMETDDLLASDSEE